MNTKNLKSRVFAQLNANTWISTTDIAAGCGISVANAKYYLEQFVVSGEAERDSQIVRHLDSNASSRRYIYRLAQSDTAPAEDFVPPTPPAYRNLRLSETLTDWERANRDFAALCMMVRR
jgi:hypothetical protein